VGAPQTGEYYGIRNPAQPKQLLGQFPGSGTPDAEAAVAAAVAARDAWAAIPGPQRGALLYRFAQLLEESKMELGRIVTLEQGKTIGEATGEVGRAAVEARYMAGEASRPIGRLFRANGPVIHAGRFGSRSGSSQPSVPGISPLLHRCEKSPRPSLTATRWSTSLLP